MSGDFVSGSSCAQSVQSAIAGVFADRESVIPDVRDGVYQTPHR